MCRVPVPTQGLLLSGPGLFRREGGDSGALGRRRRAPQPAAAPSPGPGVLSGVLDGADLPVMRGRIRAEGRARRFLRPGPRLTGPGYLCSRARRGGGRAGCAQRALREAVPLAGDAAPTTPGRAGARCSAGAPGARVRGSRRGTRARLSRAGLVPRTRGPAPGDPAPQGPSCAAPAPRPRTRAPAGGANWAGFVPRLSGRGRRGLGDWSPCPGSRAGGGDRDCGRGTCAPGGAGAGRARGGRGGGGPGLAAAPPGPGHLRPAPPAAPEPGNLGAALGEWLLVPGLVRLRGSQSLPAGCGRAESRVCGVVGVPCGTRLLLSRGEKSGAPGEGMTDSTAMQNKEIDCLSPEAQKLAEARLAAKRAARAEAREIRMKELERQQKEVEERPEKDFTEKGSRNMPSLSAATLASLGGTSSRRGSGDTSISIDTEASIREIKDALAEVEEKYKKAMVSNAQLDNEKTNFMYQVDTLKDVLLELEEQLAESRRQYEEKNKEFEREKHAHSVLQFQFAEVKEALKQREEMLEKHGIILNSEIATNGETSGPLNDVGYQGFTKMTKEELSALTATGDGTLGRASEVAVKSEMVENVGQREILQNTEQEPHKEDTVKDCVDTEVLHPGESAEDQSSSEDSAPSPGTLANAGCEEQVQGHILEHPAFPKNTEQIQSDNVVDLPGDRTTASLEQNRCLPDLESEIPGPLVGQSSCNDLGIENGSKESAEMQEKENQEDFKTNLGEVSAKPCQGSVPLQLSEVERVSSAGTGGQPGSPTNSVVEAGGADVGEQVSTRASSSPERSDDPVSCGEKHGLVDAPQELDPSTAHSLEKELATQDVAEPKEAPMQRENSKEEDGETELMDERPSQPEVKTIPSSPAAQSDHQEAASARMLDAESGPLDPREPGEGKSNQQGEVLDSSPKKTKSKKKKNKKKKSPVPVETLKDVAKELTFQNTDLSEVKEEEQETFTDKKPAEEAQGEVAPDPNQDVVTGISENVNCPENPKIDLDGKLNQEDDDEGAKAGEGVADGDMLDFEDGAAQPPSPSGGDKELDEGVIKDNTKEDGADQICPPEPKNEEIQSSTLLENESPPQEINGAPQIESNEKRAVSEHPGHAVEEALDSINLEDADSPAPAGEVGDLELESKNDARSRNEKGRSKEDCTMS
ncbi:leucine-rich repeat flightless-interacting protein 1 isoform X22 [Choloepus didactylus]|uniref:leucine-rich repeat flightless-interacting protein 1 isoform X22 n=1 Tax=Choloepus didactylus TaxID=27675 RepID=UPI00189FF429|nr:leucine-rich repeat flightless-interacting protein 1 isoform X22 [Choloepus didactylus]